MNDRELLELAAKAAGYNAYFWSDKCALMCQEGRPLWNPLTDDGDALRLASKLKIKIGFCDGFKQVICRREQDCDNFEMHGIVGFGDGAGQMPTAENARRAIVLAAAKIGRGWNDQD